MATMFDIPFRADAFPSSVARAGVLHFDAGALAHALFVTGRAPSDRGSHGALSVWEWIHRASLVPAYVRRGPTGRLMKSTLADSLDRSEKVGLSYALGQAMTGIFCEQKLGVLHLMHVDRYAARWRVDFGGARRRADLFGRIGPTRWVVAEAKGRSNGMETDLRRILIAQKGSIRSIAGHRPTVSLGCVASFPVLRGGIRGPMRVDAFDPEPSKEAMDLTVDEPRFLQTYYEPFAAAIAVGVETEGPPEYVSAALPAVGLRVGMRQELYEAIQSRNRDTIGAAVELMERDPIQGRRPDGTFVEADFEDALSIQDYDK